MRNDARIRQKYGKAVAGFREHEARVRAAIQRWKERGHLTRYEKYHGMYTHAERLRTELEQELAHENALSNPAHTNKKVKELQKVYGLLQQETKHIIRQWVEAIVVALTLALVIRNLAFTLYHVPTGSAEPNILVGDRIWGNKAAYIFDDVKRGDLVIFDDPREGYDESSKIQAFWQRYIGFPIPLLGLKSGPINVVKRVIGIPGDVVEGRIEEGKTVVYLNGKKLDEPHVNSLPLVWLYRDKGVLPFSAVGPLRIPDFLRQERKLVRYTYDPEKPLSDQPYYYMDEKDLFHHPVTGNIILSHAFTPSASDHPGVSVDEFGPHTIPANMYWVMGDSRKNSEDSRYWHYLDKKYVHGRASFILYSVDSEEALWAIDMIKHPIDFFTKHVRWNRLFKKLN